MQSLFASYSSYKTAVPSDSSPQNCRAIYVGGAGDVTIKGKDGNTVLFKAPPVGTILPLVLDGEFLMATGTTATLMILLA